MSHGGLPPRRPDQVDTPTPRVPVPGARTTPVVNKAGTTLTVLEGGVPGLTTKQSVGAGAQVATTFYTFTGAGRIWAVSLAFDVASNASFSGGVQQFYAAVQTGGGLLLAGRVELALSAIGQSVNGNSEPGYPGISVANGTTLQLDVNNGVAVGGGGGVMRASVVVWLSIP